MPSPAVTPGPTLSAGGLVRNEGALSTAKVSRFTRKSPEKALTAVCGPTPWIV